MPAGDDAAEGRDSPRFRLPSGGRRRMRTGRAQVRREEDKELVVARTNDELSHLDPDKQRKLPCPMAELIVFPLDTKDLTKGFGLRGASCCGPTARNVHDPTRVNGEPRLSIDQEIKKGGTLPDKFVLRMDNWSEEQVALRDWLNECRSAHNGELELVIWDDTGFRIPWELLWLPPNLNGRAGEDGRLGAVATVTRWLSLHPSTNAPAPVKTWVNHEPYRARGSVAAYIAPDMKHDASLFNRFMVETVDSMSNLFTSLQASDPSSKLAMVYVACHGKFSDNPDDCVLGGFPLGLTTRLNHDLIRVREQDTLVFLNGCNTGAMASDERNKLDKRTYNDGALRGFAKFFLLCGAAEVLATTGAVGNEDAGHVTDGLLKLTARPHPETTVAGAVRQLRAEAAGEMTEDLFLEHESCQECLAAANWEQAAKAHREQANKKLHQLLFPFMYVCFGSPRMLLALNEREGPADTGQLTGTGG